MAMTSQRITGGLLSLLRVVRRAWYCGPDGITAYYEQPDQAVPGAVYINGKRICSLKVDDEGLYWDVPSPDVQERIRRYGVLLETGWTCEVERVGSPLEEALAHSRRAQHQPSGVEVQRFDECQLSIWVNGIKQGSTSLRYVRQVVSELGASPDTGWFPEQAQYLSNSVVRLS